MPFLLKLALAAAAVTLAIALQTPTAPSPLGPPPELAPPSAAEAPEPLPEANLEAAETTAEPAPSTAHAADPTSRERGPAAAAADAASPGTRLRRLKDREVTPAIGEAAKRILQAHRSDPYGTEVPFEADGKRYVGRVEEHYHPPGGPARPWGKHPGISVFAVEPVPPRPGIAGRLGEL
jgi:hypothetical protein